MRYDHFKFIYPPRAEAKVRPDQISTYDTPEYIAQIKYNGSCCSVFLHESMGPIVINRHSEPKTRIDAGIDFRSLCGPKWMVLTGELMDKSKKGETGATLTGFIIWDILVYENIYMIGSSLEDRINTLERLWPCHRMRVTPENGLEEFKHLCHTGVPGIYRAPSYIGGLNGFESLYQDVVKTDAYEGLILKKIHSRLEMGYSSGNNTGWQIKFRKPTKNYKW